MTEGGGFVKRVQTQRQAGTRVIEQDSIDVNS